MKSDLARLLVKEEKMWQQRSKAHWMKLGDKNSSYFHNKASQRYRRNRILGLKDSRAVMCIGDDRVVGLLENYYQQLFTSSNSSEIDGVTQHIGWVVTEEMNKEFTRDFTRAEVELALNQMAPLKASGPDGMSPTFYQHYWQNIRDDMTNAVLHCLNTRKIFTGLNHTYITLIPKVKIS